MMQKPRTVFLVIDGLALVGTIAFSVLAALAKNGDSYVIGQIVCALILIGSITIQHRTGRLPWQ